jgi:membrane protease YdiL (CAAX protease family)
MFLWGAGFWLAVQIAATLLDYLIAPRGFRITATGATAALAASAFLGLAIQTFAEEFVFRGYITQGLLLAIRRPGVTAVVSGLLFGSLHIPNGWPQPLGATIFGVITALIAIRTGGIAFTAGLHLVNNLFGAVVVVSATDVFKGSPGLVSQATPQLMWWDVGVTALALAGTLWIVGRSRKKDAGHVSARTKQVSA